MFKADYQTKLCLHREGGDETRITARLNGPWLYVERHEPDQVSVMGGVLIQENDEFWDILRRLDQRAVELIRGVGIEV